MKNFKFDFLKLKNYINKMSSGEEFEMIQPYDAINENHIESIVNNQQHKSK